MKLNVSSVYEQDRDLIRVYIETDDEVQAEIELDAAKGTIFFDDMLDVVSKSRCVNQFHFVQIALAALVNATDENTEMPLVIDDSIVVDF